MNREDEIAERYGVGADESFDDDSVAQDVLMSDADWKEIDWLVRVVRIARITIEQAEPSERWTLEDIRVVLEEK